MSFTSLTFILFFFLVLTGYWALSSRKAQNLLLVLASYVFYGWWDYRFCGLMIASSLIDYYVSHALEKSHLKPHQRKIILSVSIFSNLALLGFFKYYGFFVESAQAALASIGFETSVYSLYIILPVGISFYTFQTMGYTIDVYRRNLPPCRSLLDYLAFVSFFPQLVAGPIERAGNLLPQFLNERRFDGRLAADGCRQMLWGFFKKMIIADNVGIIVATAYGDPGAMTSTQLLLATVFFAFQIYCDFSGYSDIAIGTSKLFGINLMRNFAYPYFSQSIDEFWRRWHISLSTWFRDYLYVPLGGSRASRIKQARNIMITFTVSGLWHGASWNFIIWGALNGIGILPLLLLRKNKRATPQEIPGGERFFPSLPVMGKMMFTFSAICITWIFFRGESLADSWLILQKIFTWSGVTEGFEAKGFHAALTTRTMLALIVLLVGLEWIQRRHHHVLVVDHLPQFLRWTIYSLVFWMILILGTHYQGQFIYFQF